MATTTSTQYSDMALSEALADEVLEEARPKNVASRLINMYSISGSRAPGKKLNRWNDPGRAAAGTEGVRFTDTTQLGSGTSTLTPAEFAVMLVLVTNDAVELRTGIPSLAEVMQSGAFAQKLASLAPEARIVGASLFETLEFDTTALFAGFSSSVGTTTQDMGLDDFDNALATLENAEDLPHEDIVACLDKRQHADLRTELMVTSGGTSGTIWNSDLASIVDRRNQMPENGLVGGLLGVPVYRHGIGARQTANAGADVVGAMFLRGYGAPEDGDGGQPGALAFVEGRRPVFTIEGDHRERGAELQGNWKGVVGERIDAWGVGIITDA